MCKCGEHMHLHIQYEPNLPDVGIEPGSLPLRPAALTNKEHRLSDMHSEDPPNHGRALGICVAPHSDHNRGYRFLISGAFRRPSLAQ